MNSSMCGADTATDVKIVATALRAASIVIWVGIAARISSTPTAASVTNYAGATYATVTGAG
jgi:hypothetical protein